MDDRAPKHDVVLPCHILVVEDHTDTLEVLIRLLKRNGFLVTAAQSVTEAKQLIAELKFDLLISDVGLPDGSGLDVLAEWRLRGLRPAVAITGYAMPNELERIKAAGFDTHLVKPVAFAAIMQAIAMARKAGSPIMETDRRDGEMGSSGPVTEG